MWLRLKPLLQVGAIHSLTTCAHSRQSERETRQEMASWRKAADEGHEMVARHGMSPVSEPTFLVLYLRDHCSFIMETHRHEIFSNKHVFL
ncbi:hypothetical protein BKA67DRAFT_586258, partial [Truncatella angustata]